ncbi:MAG: hypothetical protein H0V91_08835 [Flavisolibacter sp.]|nr:hypothetical protein [Flavisolibacter sp.]
MNTFKSTNNSLTKTSNYLILVISNSGEIIKGNILQFIPPSGEELHVPKHTFSKIYNYQSLQCNGIFNILTIDDRFSYKLHFEQGTLKSVSVPKKAAINVRVMGCIDWYLVTTYYFDDGTSYTTESFVRRSCDNGPGEWQNMQPDDSGGGSPDQIVYEYEVVKDVIWNVGTSPTGIGEIKSTERAKGKRYTTMPGGYFTKFDHSYTICNFCSSYNNNVFTEQEAFATYQTSIATSSVKGVLYYDGNSYAISNAETWSFSQIFP